MGWADGILYSINQIIVKPLKIVKNRLNRLKTVKNCFEILKTAIIFNIILLVLTPKLFIPMSTYRVRP